MKILIKILFTGVLFCCGAFQGFDNRRICNPLQELNNIIQIEENDCSHLKSLYDPEESISPIDLQVDGIIDALNETGTKLLLTEKTWQITMPTPESGKI